MKRILIFIIIILIAYFIIFNIDKQKLKYVTVAFYGMSLLSSLSHLSFFLL
jgi:uncharacterized integral membrane protein